MVPKSRQESKITMTQIVLPYHANVAGNMHGGEVMKLMDSAAGVVAARHCLQNVVTASVTQLSFIEPIFVGDLVICNAELNYTGRTSMEVHVWVDAEDLTRGLIKHVSEGYFFMVALDRNGRPTEIPPLLIETEEQRNCADAAQRRIALMKQVKHTGPC
ncbi:acyl-CoA thioesterase [Syntrophomonas palmitatica]|uniref:acyl-CoA thioesterase n=1 Tax=Syntrophomonas palmitatica TaxID=402877 RepID=UPI0006CF6CCE|nr:acyl-CoA thioesterase [Syntrophomonas palmitatica]